MSPLLSKRRVLVVRLVLLLIAAAIVITSIPDPQETKPQSSESRSERMGKRSLAFQGVLGK